MAPFPIYVSLYFFSDGTISSIYGEAYRPDDNEQGKLLLRFSEGMGTLKRECIKPCT